jgi:hypothetical protein
MLEYLAIAIPDDSSLDVDEILPREPKLAWSPDALALIEKLRNPDDLGWEESAEGRVLMREMLAAGELASGRVS